MEPLGPDDPREISGYPLEARIGEGGMGTVYLSRTRGNRPLALKVIRREYARDPQYRRRFAREAQAARKVAGYHLVPVLDFDTDAEQPWIASAYQPGLPLDSLLDRYGPLPVPAALQVTGCLARALHAVHAAGYVHRDVKPSNALIGSDGPWLIDFGIARSDDTTNLTVTGGIVGTPRFMSPEHARGREPGPASDVFSLGLLAAVTGTGRHPYGDGTGLGVAALIAATDTGPPDLDGYPEPLRQVLRAALAADPGRRPGADELAALCEELADRPLTGFDDWLPPTVAAAVASAEEAATLLVRRPQPPSAAPATPPLPPPSAAPSAAAVAAAAGGPAHPPVPGPGAVPAGGFGPPPSMGTTLRADPSAGSRRRAKVLTVAVAALAVAAVTVAGTLAWQADDGRSRDDRAGSGAQADRPAGTGPAASPGQTGDGRTGDGKDDGDGGRANEGGGGGDGGGERPVPSAPAGYTLLFAHKPFTFAPPPADDRANHLDFDVPRSTTMERGALPGPAELVYNSDGWLGSMLVVVGKRTTVCTEEQQTAVLSHPLPAAELRLGRQVKVGTVLCSITSNDNVAEAEITEIVPGEGPDGLPTYKGYVTAWKRPDPGPGS
ncbi:serine/threonine-protein kinase [Streptomyces sp. NPDC029526]|uniref:serine/threonine-protein kinase n=1 Tax=Streptomyces sp. NPDC029526 TaxID=3155728 RepID=UPI0033E34FA1